MSFYVWEPLPGICHIRDVMGVWMTLLQGSDRALLFFPETCPERLLLFFHRLPYSHVMRDGRTLIQRIYDDHFEGYRTGKEERYSYEKDTDCNRYAE